MDKFDSNRRKLLALGGAALGVALLPTQAFASLSTSRPRVLTLSNLNTGESLKTEFFNGKKYDKDELARLRSVEHTSAFLSRGLISYVVLCLRK